MLQSWNLLSWHKGVVLQLSFVWYGFSLCIELWSSRAWNLLEYLLGGWSSPRERWVYHTGSCFSTSPGLETWVGAAWESLTRCHGRPGVGTSATSCHWSREPEKYFMRLMKNICRWVERLLSHGMVMVQSWRINLNFQWFYSPLNMTKTHSSLVRISSLCTVSGSTTWSSSSSSSSFSLPFWSVFLHLKLDCLIRNGTLCRDSLDFCLWTWWTPTPDPVKY